MLSKNVSLKLPMLIRCETVETFKDIVYQCKGLSCSIKISKYVKVHVSEKAVFFHVELLYSLLCLVSNIVVLCR